jgi:hypothetical protein
MLATLKCIRWMGDDRFFMPLEEADIHALRGRVRPN